MEESLRGIAEADERLGRPFPLPAAPLPLVRWVDVRGCGDGVEVVWSLDDSRPGAPGRLALYAGPSAAPRRDVAWDGPAAGARLPSGADCAVRSCRLDGAQPSLRPVTEVCWRAGGLHLRLTAQGPWDTADLLGVAGSIGGPTG